MISLRTEARIALRKDPTLADPQAILGSVEIECGSERVGEQTIPAICCESMAAGVAMAMNCAWP